MQYNHNQCTSKAVNGKKIFTQLTSYHCHRSLLLLTCIKFESFTPFNYKRNLYPCFLCILQYRDGPKPYLFNEYLVVTVTLSLLKRRLHFYSFNFLFIITLFSCTSLSSIFHLFLLCYYLYFFHVNIVFSPFRCLYCMFGYCVSI